MRTTQVVFLLAIFLLVSSVSIAQVGKAPNRINLHQGWTLQSSAKIEANGEAISKAKFPVKGWYKTSVPMTVLAAQVETGEYPDIFYGMNLRKLPGIAYEIGEQFAHKAIPPDSPYAASWWYRTEFATPAKGKRVTLHFDGINNRANIWINGQKIADAKDVAGAYRTYEFDITPHLAKTGMNALAVEVFAQTQSDLGINWVDWNPTPPDKDMGLWQDVYLTTSGPVTLRYPSVETHLTGDKQELTIVAELHNLTDAAVEGKFDASIDTLKLRVEQAVALAPGESKTIKLSSKEFPQLAVKDAKLWWPAQMGTPNLYEMTASVHVANAVSDSQNAKVGIREVTSEMTDKGARLFKVNGKPILIRGGGWAPDMLLRRDSKRLRDELDYVQGMNLNTIRLEGKMESDEFFNLADERGILIMAGWCCCDLWEEWSKWQGDQLAVGAASVRSQALRLRSHASMVMWLNGSDNPPPAEVERAYLAELEKASWPNPIVSSATQQVAQFSGPSGVKMTGPYDYVPPTYWYIDTKHGGAYGFNTETSPGPAVPPPNSLRKFIPSDELWPMGEVWNFHSGSGGFKNLKIYNAALNAEYGDPMGLEDYTNKSQAMAYDGERAMFEAYTRNKYTSTGVIQWMLNNAWPSMIWHLYDYYLQPAGGYFGVKKANEPVHIQYSYDDRSVAVVNSTYKLVSGLKASVKVVDFDLKELFAQEKPVDLASDEVQKVMAIPEPSSDTSSVYFVQMALKDASGKLVSSNFYWLSTKKPEFDWEKTTYISTPITAYEDMTLLAKLPKVKVEASATSRTGADGHAVRVRIKNPSKALAFQVRLAIEAGPKEEEVLPVLWDDNYVSLMPGEEREVEARFPGVKAIGIRPTLKVSGWNIEPESIALSGATKSTEKPTKR
ncbi:MAG TPA: beta galactosidase jelly roll domain-containing protein [Terriglobales bacterium]